MYRDLDSRSFRSSPTSRIAGVKIDVAALAALYERLEIERPTSARIFSLAAVSSTSIAEAAVRVPFERLILQSTKKTGKTRVCRQLARFSRTGTRARSTGAGLRCARFRS